MFNKDLYPTVETFKYPKARDSLVSLHIYDVARRRPKKSIWVSIMIFILPAWNGQMQMSYQQVLNRHQDNLICCLSMGRRQK
jgi:dipeptidyl-peptidase-4